MATSSDVQRPHLPPEVVLMFVGTSKSRFWIPSEQNFFGDFQIGHVLYDSGCNTILLPLKPGDISKLMKLYPPSDRFSWSINSGHGSSRALWIVPSEPSIRCRLATDLFPNSNFSLPALRFHICPEDAEEIINHKPLDDVSIGLLGKWVEKVRAIKKEYGIELASRRNHALLGQFFFLDAELSLHQFSKNPLVDRYKNSGSVCLVYRHKPKNSKELVRTEAMTISPSVIQEAFVFRTKFLISDNGQTFEEADHQDMDPLSSRDNCWDENFE